MKGSLMRIVYWSTRISNVPVPTFLQIASSMVSIFLASLDISNKTMYCTLRNAEWHLKINLGTFRQIKKKLKRHYLESIPLLPYGF
jgi:hypothetical protein